MSKLDLYSILGIPKNASSRDITSAYRKLALKYHPDRNKSPFANEMMLRINTAYNILSDPIKREEYDYSLLAPEEIPQREPVKNDTTQTSISDFVLAVIINTKSNLKVSLKILLISFRRVLNFLKSN